MKNATKQWSYDSFRRFEPILVVVYYCILRQTAAE